MLLQLIALLFAASLGSTVSALNVLLTNDDSWASANIRATFDALTKAGHNVLLVAPAINESGQGGRFTVPTVNITAPGGEFGSIPVGAPFFGHDENSTAIWYFNSTPEGAVALALDVIAPMHFGGFGNETIDLVVAGPNEGLNTGPFLFTLSGTIAATYFATERGIPAVGFSSGNGTHRSFATNTGLPNDPANIVAGLVVNFVDALTQGVNASDRILPLGVGVNINFPTFGPDNTACTNPPFILSRISTGSVVPFLTFDPDTFTVTETDLPSAGSEVCFNGDCLLIGEETLIDNACASSVSVFSIDYDAPSNVAAPIQSQLANINGRSKIAS